MAVNRIARVNQLLHREIGSSLFRFVRDESVDLSRVMISHVITSRDLRHARVLVSVMGTPDQQQNAMRALAACRADLQAHIGKTVRLKYTPRLNFELDPSVAQGDHVLDILDHLEISEPEAGGAETDGEVPS